jgi:hypothetical protein
LRSYDRSCEGICTIEARTTIAGTPGGRDSMKNDLPKI